MANYLCQASGSLSDTFPWSIRSYVVSSLSETGVATAWDTGIKAMWNSAGLNALIPVHTHLLATSAASLDSNFKQISKTTTAEALVGTATASLPFECAHVVTWRVIGIGRSERGRWYLPPLGTGALAANGYTLSAASQTSLQTAVNAFLTSIRGSLTLVVFHRKLHTTENITGGDITDQVNAQRIRGRKRVPTRVALTV